MADDTPKPANTAQNPQSESSSHSTAEAGAGLFAEKERIGRLERIRQFVFGSLDGLLVPLGVISGVAGGTGSTKAVIVAGIAEAFAGALSMGAGEFIAGRSEAQVRQTEIAKEVAEIKNMPEYEAQEMARLFAYEGVAEEDAAKLADILTRYPDAYHKTMVEKELGLQMEVSAVKIPEALTIGGSYLVGSIFPLIAYFFLPISQALPVSLVLTVIALIVVGYVKGRLASLNLVVSIVEVVIVGGASALGGYFLGSVIPHLLGF